MIRRILGVILFIAVLGSLLAGVAAMWAYNYLIRDLPKFERVEDYRPAAVSQIFSDDGTLVGEFYLEEGRRYPIKIADVPLHVRNAFLASEDASFYTHKGIDPISILRAIYTNLRQGGATDIFNCGYSKGYSVLEVIGAVKRASNVDFPVQLSPRRPGDPAAIVAGSAKIRERLGWKPENDDLDQIVAQALAWEKRLSSGMPPNAA